MSANGDREPSEVGFATKLGRFLLVSYASGVDVEGEWTFVDTDEIVPDFVIVILRTDDGGDGWLHDAEVTFEPGDLTSFKTSLYDLLLQEFSQGNDVLGTWPVRYAALDLPEWSVRIETVGQTSDVDCLRRTF